MDIFKFISENELFIVAALWGLGEIVKRTELINNKFIPLILLVTSLGLTPMVMGGFSAEHVVQAILVAAGAVFADQLLKQYLPKEETK